MHGMLPNLSLLFHCGLKAPATGRKVVSFCTILYIKKSCGDIPHDNSGFMFANVILENE